MRVGCLNIYHLTLDVSLGTPVLEAVYIRCSLLAAAVDCGVTRSVTLFTKDDFILVVV